MIKLPAVAHIATNAAASLTSTGFACPIRTGWAELRSRIDAGHYSILRSIIPSLHPQPPLRSTSFTGKKSPPAGLTEWASFSDFTVFFLCFLLLLGSCHELVFVGSAVPPSLPCVLMAFGFGEIPPTAGLVDEESAALPLPWAALV